MAAKKPTQQKQTASKGTMTVAEAGRKGGQIGGRVVAQKYGHEHFEEIGRKGGQKVAELIERGKRASR
jgi:general stress protein YciG